MMPLVQSVTAPGNRLEAIDLIRLDDVLGVDSARQAIFGAASKSPQRGVTLTPIFSAVAMPHGDVVSTNVIDLQSAPRLIVDPEPAEIPSSSRLESRDSATAVDSDAQLKQQNAQRIEMLARRFVLGSTPNPELDARLAILTERVRQFVRPVAELGDLATTLEEMARDRDEHRSLMRSLGLHR